LIGILSSPWTMLLLHRLHLEGPKRFGELRRRLGAISTKTLTERLRMLESEGWVNRHYEPTVPPQVTYSIADKVMELDGGAQRTRPDRRPVVREETRTEGQTVTAARAM
jgi:DNA-binding HxlR family transcriptional regulator